MSIKFRERAGVVMMQAGRALRIGMVRIPFVSSLATKARAFASVGSVEKALFGPESADISRGTCSERSPGTVKAFIASRVVVVEKNLL